MFSAAAVLKRSSQKAFTGSPAWVNLFAKLLVAWHLGPSVPFMFKGKPITIPPTFLSRQILFNSSMYNNNDSDNCWFLETMLCVLYFWVTPSSDHRNFDPLHFVGAVAPPSA